jgi:hypothetical protein
MTEEKKVIKAKKVSKVQTGALRRANIKDALLKKGVRFDERGKIIRPVR